MAPTASRAERRRAQRQAVASEQSFNLAGHPWIIGLMLAFATLALYLPVIRHQFVNYDDDNYVTQNVHVQAGLTWDTVTWALTSTSYSNWHPVTWLSHALDCSIWGLDPAGHHFINASLHAANAMLLFLLLGMVTGKVGRSAVVAALFAAHPINVESVAWVAERKNVLSTLFLLLTIAAYGWYARKPDVKRYVLMAVLFAFGLAAKPMLVTLPFVLLLLDYWPLRRIEGWTEQPSDDHVPTFPVQQATIGRLILEKLPLLAMSAATSAVTVVAQGKSGAIHLFLPFGVRLENAIYAYAMYLQKAFWPGGLAPFYPHPGYKLAWWQAFVAGLLLAAVSALVLRERARRPYLILGWLWFLGTLVPVIGLVQVGDQAMADRYAYVPLIGIFLMVIWAAAEWCDRKAVGAPVRTAVTVVVLAVLSFLTSRQLGFWATSHDLWQHTVDVTKDNTYAEINLGATFLVQGRGQDALPHFQNAVRINPHDAASRLNMGATLSMLGHTQEAIEQYEIAIPLVKDPGVLSQAYESLGVLYGQIGNYAKAREDYQEALRFDPDLTSAKEGLAAVNARKDSVSPK